MAAPARPFGVFGLVIRVAASVLFGLLFREMPTLFSSAPAYAKSWDEALWATLFSALVIFGVSYFANTAGPPLDRRVNKGLTILLAIPVIAMSPFMVLILLRWLFVHES